MQLVCLGRTGRSLQAFVLWSVVSVNYGIHLLAYRCLDHMYSAYLWLRAMNRLRHGRLALLHQASFCLVIHDFDHAFARWACPCLLRHELGARLHALVGINIVVVLTLPRLLILTRK